MAVIDSSYSTDSKFDKLSDNDFRIEWFSGTGAGGQHRNKTQNCCRVIHIPTGLVEARQGRKRESNLRDAKQSLLIQLTNGKQSSANKSAANVRNNQIGSGMRGDKIRTYRFQEDKVIDHQANKTARLKQFIRGNMDKFWD